MCGSSHVVEENESVFLQLVSQIEFYMYAAFIALNAQMFAISRTPG